MLITGWLYTYACKTMFKFTNWIICVQVSVNNIVAYATGRNDTEVYRSYFIHSVNQVKLQYINTQSSMSDIIMNNTGIGIIKIRIIIFSLFYATIMQLTSIPAL